MTVAELVATLGFEMNKGDKGKVEDAINGLKQYAEKALGALGVGFSIAGIKQLVEVAADMKAIDTQFKQTFKDKTTFQSYYNEASKALRKVSDETGIAESRMKKSFSDISAFAQTGGMGVTESLEFTDRAMRVAADSAAYYDRSIEETTMLMKSLLKGNYMVDDNLGFQATELTRNAKAAELYGKKFNDLTEAQKQTTIVEMIAAANKAMGAEGQAANEAGEWTNTLGNLTARIRELKGAMGDAFLAPAIFVVKTLSRWTVTLTDHVKVLTKEGGVLQKITNQWADTGQKLRRIFSPTISMIQRGINHLHNQFRILKIRIGGVENILHPLTVAVMGFVAAFALTKVIAGLQTVFKVLGMIMGAISPIHIAIALIALLVEDFLTFLSGGDSVIGDVLGQFGITAEDAQKAIQNFVDNGVKKLKEFGKNARQFLKTAKEMGEKAGAFLKDAWSGNPENPLTPIFERLKEAGPKLMELVSAIQQAGATLVAFLMQVKNVLFGDVFGPVLQFFGKIFLGGLMTAVDGFIGIVNGLLDTLTHIFNLITGLFSGNKEMIMESLQGILQGAGAVLSGLLEMVIGIGAAIFSAAAAVITTIWAAIEAFFNNFGISTIEALENLLNNIASGLSDVPGTVEAGFQGAIDFLTSLPEKALKWGADFVNGLIDGIKSGIDTLTGVAGDVAGRVTAFFHCSRPDEGPLREYEKWMPDMMQGFASTMQSSGHLLVDQASAIAGRLSETMLGAMGSLNAEMAGMMDSFATKAAALTSVAQASFAAARVSTVNNNHTASVTQNNTFNNSYTGGDRQTQKNVSKGMRKSAIDASTQMADALKYARG